MNKTQMSARLSTDYQSSMARFTTPDVLAEKRPWHSPYAYCGGNPVNAIDPDGREWFMTSSRDLNGNLNIDIRLTGVVYDNTNNHSLDLDNIAGSIKLQLEDVYTFSGKGFSIKMTADIRVAKSYEDVTEKDHVFAIMNDSFFSSYKKDTTPLALGDFCGLRVFVSNKLAEEIGVNKNTRSIAHEIGHTGGLYDNDDKIVDRGENLMMQISHLAKGSDKNSAIKLEVWQINEIIKNFNNRKLNQNSPVYTVKYKFRKPQKRLYLE